MTEVGSQVIAEVVAARLSAARHPMVLTGAGMSAESGVATFRESQTGLWAQFNPLQLATPDAWTRDRELVWAWYCWRASLVRRAEPHDGHRVLARLGKRIPTLQVVTQNVDDLHQRAGSEGVIHLHGSLFTPRCDTCGEAAEATEMPAVPIDDPPQRLAPPGCRHCPGHLRPGVVWFSESLPENAWRQAAEAAARADVVLIIGTSGLVYPAASLPGAAMAAGAFVVEINPQETALSRTMSLHWGEGARAALSAIEGHLSQDRK